MYSFLRISAQEVSFDISPSFVSGVKYSEASIESNLKPQLSLGFGYVHKFTANWAVVTGIHFGRLNSIISVKDAMFTSNRVDDRDSAFELRVTPNNLKEHQQQNYYKIPLLVQYSRNLSVSTQVYGALGASYYGFTHQTSTVKASSIQVSGYYPDMNIEIDNAPNHGFGRLNKIEKTIETNYNSFVAFSAEAGLKWNIKTDFYLGVFFNYSLTELQKQKGNLVSHNSTSLNIDSIKGVSYLTNIGKPQFYNFGLKLRMGLFNLY